MDSDWDYVIVGGGSAGCVLANRLSEDRTTRVLLLEAGERDWYPFLHVPGLLRQALGRSSLLWNLEGAPDDSRNGARTTWRAGRVLGGGSSVNGLVWIRGHAADFDRWADLGCTGWDADSVEPYFERAETFERSAARRGDSGPIHVEMIRAQHPLTDLFVDAAKVAGFPYTDDYNGAQAEGVGFAQSNTHRGFRASTARAYLGAAKRRKNLTVWTKSTADRVLFDGTRAIGVTYKHRGETRSARANREVILSAGAVGSAKLLMLSGIGGAAQLEALGIRVLFDSPKVGANLHEHPVSAMMWEVDMRTFNMDMNPLGILRHGLNFVLRGRGPAAACFFHAILLAKLDQSSIQTEFEAGFIPLGIGSPTRAGEEGEHNIQSMKLLAKPTVTVYVSLLHPKSRGRVILRSASPDDAPILRLDLFDEAKDLEELKAACEEVRRIFATAPLESHVVQESAPGPAVASDDAWEKYLRSGMSWGAQHLVGTCAMGSSPDSVVDPTLRVRGVRGLRVVDASVMPEITGGNTNAPTIMIGEKAADLIKSAAPRGTQLS